MSLENKAIIKNAVKGISWNLANRLTSNIGQLVIYFVLARLLTPSDFGIIAVVTVFVNLSRIFSNAGLGASIVQQKKIDTVIYSSIFMSSFYISLIIGFLLFCLSPYISSFYPEIEELSFYIRVSIPAILFGTINSIQISVLQRDLKFKEIFFCSTIPIIIAGVISIILAFFGFGILSLLANVFLCSFLSFIYCFVKYVDLPSFKINIYESKKAINFSYKILLSALVEELNKSAFVLLIGYKFNQKILGNYNFGKQIPGVASATLNASLASVLFPFYSRLNATKEEISIKYIKILRSLNFLIIPFIFLSFLISENFILFFFTTKWENSVFFLKMFSIIIGVNYLQNNITFYINSLGKSNITLKYEILKKTISVSVLLITLPFDIQTIVFGQVFVAIFNVLLMTIPTAKYLNYNILNQIKDIFVVVLINSFIFIFLNLLSRYNMVGYLSLLVIPILYLVLYLLISYNLNLKSFQTLFFLKNFIFKNKNE